MSIIHQDFTRWLKWQTKYSVCLSIFQKNSYLLTFWLLSPFLHISQFPVNCILARFSIFLSKSLMIAIQISSGKSLIDINRSTEIISLFRINNHKATNACKCSIQLLTNSSQCNEASSSKVSMLPPKYSQGNTKGARKKQYLSIKSRHHVTSSAAFMSIFSILS